MANGSVPGVSHMVTDVNGSGFTVSNGEARYTSAIYSGEFNMRLTELQDRVLHVPGRIPHGATPGKLSRHRNRRYSDLGY